MKLEEAIGILKSRDFCAISIMFDPFGMDDVAYLSVTHKDHPGDLRFLAACEDMDGLHRVIEKIINIHADRMGEVWQIKNNKRLALNILPRNKLLIQGTEAGIKIAREIWKVKINDADEIREVKKPS
jgi:hypothetical protein